MAELLCKVVNVMSSNPDGTGRQDIIRRIIEEEGTDNSWWGRGRIEVTDRPGEESPRIEVYVDGQKIGNVHADDADRIAGDDRLANGVVTLNLFYSPQYDVCSGRIYVPMDPTDRMRFAVDRILARNPHLNAPEYSFEAYWKFIDAHRVHGNRRAAAGPENADDHGDAAGPENAVAPGNADDREGAVTPENAVAPENADDHGDAAVPENATDDDEFDFGKANDEQKEAIRNTEGPVLITAGPGTGKTYTLVLRTIYLIEKCGVSPENIFIATFTEKAARELVTRITNELIDRDINVPVNEMYVGTFHSLCLRIIKENLEHTRLKKNYKVLEQFDQIYTVYRDLDEFYKIDHFSDVIKGSYAWDFAKKTCTLVNKLSEEMVDVQALIDDEDELISDTGRILKTYQDLLKNNNMLDFAAIQTEAFKLLSEHPEVLEALQEKIRYIMIDEYQDTNYIQEQLVFLLGARHGNICVVGDDDQGLYRFRGATIRNILEFAGKFGPDECKVVHLSTNYRSDSDIIDFYNRWMRTTTGDGFGFTWGQCRLDKTIEAAEESTIGSPAVVKISGEKSTEDWCEKISGEKSTEDWCEKIYNFIDSLQKSGKITDLNQLAFLFYSVKSGPAIKLAKYLEEKGIRVYSPRSGKFFQREEVRLLFGCLMLLFPDYTGGLKKNEFKIAPHKIKSEERHKFYSKCCDDARKLLAKDENADFKRWVQGKRAKHKDLKSNTDYSYTGLIYEMLQFEPFASIIDADMQLALPDILPARNIAQFVCMVSKFEEIYNVRVLSPNERNDIRQIDRDTERLFNTYLALRYGNREGEYEDESEYAPSGCVSFLTMHQAKGMEFPVVFVDSLAKMPRDSGDDLLKSIESKYFHREAFEPEQYIKYFDFWRLYYTAFSRAQNLLVLTCNENDSDSPSPCFRELYSGLPSVDDESFDIDKFDFASVKDVNIKESFAFTSDISVYQTCGLQYKFYKELGFAPKRVGAMMFGTLVHQTIEDVHKAAISGKTELITKDNIEAWFNANYASLKSAESFDLAEPQKKAALGQVQRYVEKRKGDWSSIRKAEVDVSLVKEDYIIEGTIDLIRGEGDTVEIVDFKSEKKPDETRNADRIERYRQQLQVYAHIVEERTGLRVSRMNLYYTGDESDSPQISFPYREEAVEETIRQFDDTVHRILNKEFTACDKDARVCNECDFRHFCRRH